MRKGITMKHEVTPLYEVECDLFGASSNWIAAVHRGAQRICYDTECWINPAYAGVQIQTYDLQEAQRAARYFDRVHPLAMRTAPWNQREAKKLVLRRLSTLLDTDLGCDWGYEEGMTDEDTSRIERARDELAQEFHNRGHVEEEK